MKHLRKLAVLLALLPAAGSAGDKGKETVRGADYRDVASTKGWTKEFERGQQLLKVLAAKHDKREKVSVDAFRIQPETDRKVGQVAKRIRANVNL